MKIRRVLAAPWLVLACSLGDPEGNSTHDGHITRDETWSVADSPHRVRGEVVIHGGVSLTIAAGATILFEREAALTFGGPFGTGTLVAEGTAAAPITMKGQQGVAPGSWTGLRFRSNTQSTLRHVNVSGCGFDLPFDSLPPACLALGNPLQATEQPTLLVDRVAIEDGQGGAVTLWSRASFADGSSQLSVRNMRGYVARMRAREAGRFPAGGSFAANDSNEVRLATDTVPSSLTLVNGVPWVVEGRVLIEGPDTPIVTIPAGASIRASGSLWVGENAPGGLQVGADGGPAASLLPRATTWEGIFFRARAVNSAIRTATLESCGSAGDACLSMVGDFSGLGPAPAPVLRNVSIRQAVGTGIAMTYGGRPGPGSANLTVTGGGAEPLGIHHSFVGAIPPGQYTGNARDRVFINDYTLGADDRWPDLGIPYHLNGLVSVGGGGVPTLTIDPGVTVIAAVGTRILVGDSAPGAIHAVGTAARPIIFRGAEPIAGYWRGIVVGPFAQPSTLFDHVIVDHAGGAHVVEGSFQFYVDLGPVIRNTIIRNSASCGVIIVNGPPWTTDFTAPALGNQFLNVPRGAICGP